MSILCRCGEEINPILGCYPPECAVCRLLKNFHQASCIIFRTKENRCSCGFSSGNSFLEGLIKREKNRKQRRGRVLVKDSRGGKGLLAAPNQTNPPLCR